MVNSCCAHLEPAKSPGMTGVMTGSTELGTTQQGLTRGPLIPEMPGQKHLIFERCRVFREGSLRVLNDVRSK